MKFKFEEDFLVLDFEQVLQPFHFAICELSKILHLGLELLCTQILLQFFYKILAFITQLSYLQFFILILPPQNFNCPSRLSFQKGRSPNLLIGAHA